MLTMQVELLLNDWTRITVSGGGFSQYNSYLKPEQRVMEVKVLYDDGQTDYFANKTQRIEFERVEKVNKD